MRYVSSEPKPRIPQSRYAPLEAVLTPEMRYIIERWGNADDGNADTLLFKFATGRGICIRELNNLSARLLNAAISS